MSMKNNRRCVVLLLGGGMHMAEDESRRYKRED